MTRHYTVDYLSLANRDIMMTEDGSYTERYVYDGSGKRLSTEMDYAEGTRRGEAGENFQSDFAADTGKVWYRSSLLNSTLYTVDADGEVIAHMIYDPWGNPLVESYTDANLSGLVNRNNYTGYTWDETLGLYFAQNRFYDAENHRFTQEDVIKDGTNWYVYCGNNPINYVDPLGTVVTPANVMGAIIGAIGGYIIGEAIANYFQLTGCWETLVKISSTALITVVGWFAGPLVYQAIKPVVIQAIAAGKLIIDKVSQWITSALGIETTNFGEAVLQEGSSMRERLLNTVQNSSLRNLIDKLYRPGAIYGDGGTADFLKYVAENGVPEGYTNHFQKAEDMVRALERVINKQNLSSNDFEIAKKLIEDLRMGLELNWK